MACISLHTGKGKTNSADLLPLAHRVELKNLLPLVQIPLLALISTVRGYLRRQRFTLHKSDFPGISHSCKGISWSKVSVIHHLDSVYLWTGKNWVRGLLPKDNIDVQSATARYMSRTGHTGRPKDPQ